MWFLHSFRDSVSTKLLLIALMFDQLTASFHRAGVPPTFLVRFPSQTFKSFFGARSLIEGSTQNQKYVTYGESCEDFGPDDFSTQDVHKIGILDLHILNGNVLFIKNQKKLVPISY